MKFNFRKIASVLASTVMVSSTVAMAAAANYPAPFVQNGVADVAIVWGSGVGANYDVNAVTTIQNSLSDAIRNQGGTVSSGGTPTGDFVTLSKTSSKVNLGDSVSSVFGTTVTDDHLRKLLADGTYRNYQNDEYDYEQKITLGTSFNVGQFQDSDYMDNEPSIGIKLNSNTFVLNYTLDFVTDAQSANSSGDLTDFEKTTIMLLGKEYYIADWKPTSEVTLLDTANSDTVKEGETKTVTVGGKTYQVSISQFTDTGSSAKVRLNVNGQTIPSLSAGQSYKLSDGTHVGVKEVSKLAIAGELGFVEFSIGSGKITLTHGNEIKINDQSVDGLKSYIYTTGATTTSVKVDKIVLSWTTDDEEFITDKDGITMPGLQSLKISASEFKTPAKEITKVGYDGDERLELQIPIKDGTARFNLLYANATGYFIGLGKDANNRLKTSHNSTLFLNESVDKWFVASYNSSKDAESYLLSVDVGINNGVNRTKIRNVVTGQDICKDKAPGDTCDIGEVSLIIDAAEDWGSEERVWLRGGDGVTFDRIYSKEGLMVHLPVISGDNAVCSYGRKGCINLSAVTDNGFTSKSWHVFFAEEDKDENLARVYFNATAKADSDGDIEISAVNTGNPNLELPNSEDDTVSWVYGELGTMVKRIVTSDRGRAEIEYHGGESYVDVYLSATSSISNPTTGVLGDVTVKDTETASVSGKNWIVVGGSCVNMEASRLIGGGGTPVCGDRWTALTGVKSNEYLIQTFSRAGGKIATLVAGWGTGDTANAATALTTQTVDTSVGKKYKGSTATTLTPVMTS